MDQNYQPYSFYQEEQPVKNAAYYRGEARDALRGKWPMSVIVYFLFTVLSSTVATFAMIPMLISMFTMSMNPNAVSPESLLLTMLISMLFVIVISVLVLSPVTVGLYRIYLDLIDGKAVRFEALFSYFKKGYLSSVTTYLLYSLLVVAGMLPAILACFVAIVIAALVTQPALAALLSVMVILVGVVLSIVLVILLTYRYALSFFILAEYPTLSALDVLRNSSVLMKGNKWRLFCLQISFIGWMLLLIPLNFLTCGIGTLIGQPTVYTYLYTAQAAFYHDVAKRDAANDVEFPSLDPNDYNPDEDPNRPL